MTTNNQVETNDKRKWIEEQVGTGILDGLDDNGYDFYYKAMHDYRMSYGDADRWGWLNTLFNYNIGHDAALKIINYLYVTDDDDVMELSCSEKDELEKISEELGLDLNFKNFVKKTPIAIKYDWN